MDDPTGRLADLAYLGKKFQESTSGQQRSNIRQARDSIKNESEKVRRLRTEMVTAVKHGDTDRHQNISEHLQKYYDHN